MSLIVIALVLGLGYLWMVRGFFNAFLHLLCVLVAGALAFAAWEPLTLALLGATGSSLVEGIARGAALVLPFALGVVVLRTVTDKLIPGNLTLKAPADYAGGALCGLAVGVISVGIGLIGLSSVRLGAGFLGYRPLWYNPERVEGAGSLRLGSPLWLPADRMTAAFYSGLSERAFSAPEPLAKWYPDLHAAAYASRIAPDETVPRNSYRPGDFKIVRRYTVGDPRAGTPTPQLLEFEEGGAAVAQPYADLRGERVASGHVEGFVLELAASAKEKGKRGAGPVVFSNGQARLVCRGADGEAFIVFPHAMISQASSGDSLYGRWRFEAEADFYASVGGASTVNVALEFLVPKDAQPLGLFVKGIRVETESMPKPTAYATRQERDAVVLNGGILRGESSAPTLDVSAAVTVAGTGAEQGVAITNQLGRLTMHVQSARRGFELDDDNRILSGVNEFERNEFSNLPQAENLRVDRFGVTRDQVLVQIDVSPTRPGSLLSPTARLINADQPLRLVDAGGQSYEAVGFIYQDRDGISMRFNPAQPLSGTLDLPQLSSAREDQQLTLLFVCSFGVDVTTMAIGETATLVFDPPLSLDRRQE